MKEMSKDGFQEACAALGLTINNEGSPVAPSPFKR
jgi:hypothetical protein